MAFELSKLTNNKNYCPLVAILQQTNIRNEILTPENGGGGITNSAQIPSVVAKKSNFLFITNDNNEQNKTFLCL